MDKISIKTHMTFKIGERGFIELRAFEKSSAAGDGAQRERAAPCSALFIATKGNFSWDFSVFRRSDLKWPSCPVPEPQQKREEKHHRPTGRQRK